MSLFKNEKKSSPTTSVARFFKNATPIAAFLLIGVFTAPLEKAFALDETEIKQLYRAGRYTQVIEALGEPKGDNASQALYLGLSHLRKGETLKAIRAWQHFVKLEKGSDGGRKISKYLTLLLREEAQRLAKAQLAQEKEISVMLNPQAIAVYPFENKGSATFAPLSKGLAAMIISDLSQVKALTVVERVQIQAILNELKLAKSGLVRKDSAPRVGKLVGAGKLTTGSFLDSADKKIRLDATVTQTASGKQLSATDATGEVSEFYRLEKVLVFKILCGIGYCPESLESQTRIAVERIHTKNLKAFRQFSKGLDLFDGENYREAARAFVLALEEDPEFELARKALLDIPIMRLNVSTMIAGAEAVSQSAKLSFPDIGSLSASNALPTFQVAAPVVMVEIFQQPGSGNSGGGSPTTVPVNITIEFP